MYYVRSLRIPCKCARPILPTFLSLNRKCRLPNVVLLFTRSSIIHSPDHQFTVSFNQLLLNYLIVSFVSEFTHLFLLVFKFIICICNLYATVRQYVTLTVILIYLQDSFFLFFDFGRTRCL